MTNPGKVRPEKPIERKIRSLSDYVTIMAYGRDDKDEVKRKLIDATEFSDKVKQAVRERHGL